MWVTVKDLRLFACGKLNLASLFELSERQVAVIEALASDGPEM